MMAMGRAMLATAMGLAAYFLARSLGFGGNPSLLTGLILAGLANLQGVVSLNGATFLPTSGAVPGEG
jgi:hypothetical protein